MATRGDRFAAAVVEGGCHVALLATPLFFNAYSERVFEEDKVVLLRSLALLVLAGLAAHCWQHRHAVARAARIPWNATAPWLVYLVVVAAATACSIDPVRSFTGAYIRRQGLYTLLCYAVFFSGIIATQRTPAARQRLVSTLLLASVPFAGYALLQRFGVDPMSWAVAPELVRRRVSGTAGNPIFLAAHLILIVPFTLSRLAGAVSAARATPRSPLCWLLLLSTCCLLLLQLSALAFSQSRGPLLGLGCGLLFYLLLHLRLHAAGRSYRVRVGGLALGVVLIVVAALSSPWSGKLAQTPGLSRFHQLTTSRTAQVRFLLWQGVTDLLLANPARLALGHGPETLALTYPPFHHPQLAAVEDREAMPDRAHNRILDTLASAGLFGLLAELALHGALWFLLLRHLQLAGRLGPYAALLSAGALGGSGAAWLAGAPPGYVLLAGPAGLLATLAAYIGSRRPGRPVQTPLQGAGLGCAILAAAVAHFVEIQFGIAVVSTQLLFWVLGGLAIVLAVRAPRQPPRVPEDAAWGVLVATTLCILLWDFAVPNALQRPIWSLFASLAGGTLLAAVLLRGRGMAPDSWYRTAKWTLAPFLVYAAAHLLWLRHSMTVAAGDDRLILATQRAGLLGLVHVTAAAAVVLYATGKAARASPKRPECPGTPPREPFRGTGLLVTAALLLGLASNLPPALADIYQREAREQQRREKWDNAVTLFRRSLALQPGQDHYTSRLARALYARGRAGGAAGRGDIGQALDTLLDAHQANPRFPDHPRNLAKMYRELAADGVPDADRTRYLELAEVFFAKTTALHPNNAAVWAEWAQLAAERGLPAVSRERVERALALDPDYWQGHHLAGQLAAQQKRWQEAMEALERAAALRPGAAELWSQLGLAAYRAGNRERALEANQTVLRLDQDNFLAHWNLASLHLSLGHLQRGREHALRALQLAPPGQVAAARNLLRRAKEIGAKEKSPPSLPVPPPRH